MDQVTNISICLDCRYNLDVLYDLKSIYEFIKNQQETDEDDDLSLDAHKITTEVVRRKTALPKSLSGLEKAINTENSSSSTKKKSKRLASDKSKFKKHNRECDECHEMIEDSVDMYRHRDSGCNVCKNCWVKDEPNDRPITKKRKAILKSTNSTKLCSVFLEDIFSNTSDKNIKSLADQTEDNEPIIDISDDVNEKRIKKNLRSSHSKTTNVPKKEISEKQEKTAPKKDLKDNESSKKNNQKTTSESAKIIPESRDRTQVTKSRLKSLQKKKNEVKQIKENVDKSRIEERRSKFRSQRLQNRSKSNPSPPLPTTDISKSTKTPKNSKDSITSDDSDSENSRPYTCNICSTDYENRIEGLKHELTHSKKLGVVIEKFATSESNENNQASDVEKVDTLASEASRNIVENAADFSPMSSDNDDNKIQIPTETNDDEEIETTEVDTKNIAKDINNCASKDANNEDLSEEINKDQRQGNINEDQSDDVINENNSKAISGHQSESIVNTDSSQYHHSEELSTNKVDSEEKHANANETTSTADENNANADTEIANAEAENLKVQDLHSEVEKLNINVDTADCPDCEINPDASSETNQDTTCDNSNNENKVEENGAEYKKKDNNSETNFNDNKGTNDEYIVSNGKQESSIQQKVGSDNSSTENLSESVTDCNEDSGKQSYPHQTFIGSTGIEDKDNHSEEVKNSYKINAKSQLESPNPENLQTLMEDKTDSENKLDDYEDNLVIDERIENSELATDIHSEKDGCEKIDKLQKIIHASFGSSLQE